MRFTPFPLPSWKIEEAMRKKFLSPRSLKAGERVIKKQKEQFGLFYDEFAKYKTPLERAEYNIKKYTALYKQKRKQQAVKWLKARKKLRELPKDLKFLVYEDYKRLSKHTDDNLLNLISKAKRKPDELFFSLWINLLKERNSLKELKKILKISLRIENFYKFMLKELLEKFNKNYLFISYYKGSIILTGFPDRKTPKLNKEQRKRLINAFNCYFKNNKYKIIQKRKAKKIKYL